MYTYSCGTPYQQTYQQAACTSGFGGGGFAYILVLFILLAIICSSSFIGRSFECCEERECCFR